MTNALTRRGDQETVENSYTRWQRFKTACSAINCWKNPRTAVAVEGLRNGTGTAEQMQKGRKRSEKLPSLR